MVYITR